MNQLLRKFQVAHELQVSESRVTQLINKGELTAVKITQEGRQTCWVDGGSLKHYSQHRRPAGRPRKQPICQPNNQWE